MGDAVAPWSDEMEGRWTSEGEDAGDCVPEFPNVPSSIGIKNVNDTTASIVPAYAFMMLPEIPPVKSNKINQMTLHDINRNTPVSRYSS